MKIAVSKIYNAKHELRPGQSAVEPSGPLGRRINIRGLHAVGMIKAKYYIIKTKICYKSVPWYL